MAKYLMKYVGTYRVKAEYDLNTNDFPRDENGHIDSTFDDLYIDCKNNCRIYHYGGNILQGYVPTIVRGKQVLKDLKDIVISSDINNSEVLFTFNSKYIEEVAKRLEARTNGKNISPFSVKNLPKQKYEISTEENDKYKAIIKDLPKNELIFISHWTKEFLAKIPTKSNQIGGAIAAAKAEGLSPKNYIHKHGYWDKYCEFLKKKMNERAQG